MGDPAGADELYRGGAGGADRQGDARFAWLEVQRGFLDFAHGRYREAQSHYDRADTAYPGYWLVDEHIAELLAAQGRYADAIAFFERVASAVHRPELEQAIGELYQLPGQHGPAANGCRRPSPPICNPCDAARSTTATTLLITMPMWPKTGRDRSTGHRKICSCVKIFPPRRR